MTWIILESESKRIMHISNTFAKEINGNYLINGGSLAVSPSICELVEVSSVPEGVEPEKWCYKDGEFVLNPDWREPVSEGDTNATIDALLTEMEAILNAG